MQLAALLLSPPPTDPPASLEAFRQACRQHNRALPRSIDRAAAGGFFADRLGHAFAAGYQAALESLFPDLPDDVTASLCITERKGGHPRAIQTTLTAGPEGRYTLQGHKRWATLSDRASVLFVAATTGTGEDGRSQLRLVRVDARADGVRISPMPETPFAPEIGHAEIFLEAVTVEAEAVLPGDGYEHYIRPFRTLEDLHVLAATFGYLTVETRRQGLSPSWPARLLALISSLRDLAGSEPSHPALHVALAGVFDLGRAVIEEVEAEWATRGGLAQARWQRDRPLLGIADGVRQKRLERAWQRLAPLTTR